MTTHNNHNQNWRVDSQAETKPFPAISPDMIDRGYENDSSPLLSSILNKGHEKNGRNNDLRVKEDSEGTTSHKSDNQESVVNLEKTRVNGYDYVGMTSESYGYRQLSDNVPKPLERWIRRGSLNEEDRYFPRYSLDYPETIAERKEKREEEKRRYLEEKYGKEPDPLEFGEWLLVARGFIFTLGIIIVFSMMVITTYKFYAQVPVRGDGSPLSSGLFFFSFIISLVIIRVLFYPLRLIILYFLSRSKHRDSVNIEN